MNEEQYERERNQKEAEKERESIIAQLPNPKIAVPKIGLDFDLTDHNTRLLRKNRALPITWWRMEEGYYVKLTIVKVGGSPELIQPTPEVLNTTDAQRMMKQRDSGTYTWYITEIETEELIEEDERMERKRRLGL